MSVATQPVPLERSKERITVLVVDFPVPRMRQGIGNGVQFHTTGARAEFPRILEQTVEVFKVISQCAFHGESTGTDELRAVS